MQILGIDVGGSGIKGAIVDTSDGCLVGERFRIPTPAPATPAAVAIAVGALVDHFSWERPIGVGFPAAVRQGTALTAANIDHSWIGTNVQALLTGTTGRPTVVANDADVAGLAEMRLGAGRGVHGVVIVVTLGTGIGTALFVDGKLVPNTELGHLELHGQDAELWASDAAREREDLNWKRWSKHVDDYLTLLHRYFWPELIIVGGGVSKKHEKFLPRLTVQTRVVPAELRNHAGIIGAAMLGAETFSDPAPVVV